MKSNRNIQEKILAIIAWLTIFGACGLAIFAIYTILWLGFILGFKM